MIDFILHFCPHTVCRPTEKIKSKYQINEILISLLTIVSNDIMMIFFKINVHFLILKAFACHNFVLLELENIS